MVRPSRNIDQLLIETGRALLPETGVSQFSIRLLTTRAGVNLGMFHYHFKTRENFLNIVLQGVYEEMFAQLSFQAHADRAAIENLRASANVLGRFMRDNRFLFRRLLPDAMAGDPIARGFTQRNFPRHLAVMAGLVGQAQQAGALRVLPVLQAMMFIGGAVVVPIMMVTAADVEGLPMPPFMGDLEADILSDRAISERVDMALKGQQPDKD